MVEFVLGLSPGLLVAAIIIAFIGLISQMSLYAKAGQPPISALVPIWNVIVFCKVVGRPAKHAIFILGPLFVMLAVVLIFWPQIDGLFPIHGQGGFFEPGPTTWAEVTVPLIIIGVASLPMAYYVILMFTEVCDSFGKHETIDKILCVIFNGVYILFALGISDAVYEAPWYARKRGMPYYMPDFKHKGKKYLVTPEGPLEGSAKDQKLKIEMVDVDPSVEKKAKPESKKENLVEKKKDKLVVDVKKEEEKKAESKPVKEDKEVESKKKPTDKKEKSGKTWREEMAEKYKKKS
jgi:hypothetical protein